MSVNSHVSFPSLRHLVDGNLEGFVIGSTLIVCAFFSYPAMKMSVMSQPSVGVGWTMWIFGFGLLMLPTKVQETWLLTLTLLGYIVTIWLPRRWIVLGLGLITISVVPFFLRGVDWFVTGLAITERGSIMDASFVSTANRVSLPPIITVLIYTAMIIGTLYVCYRYWQYARRAATPEFPRELAALLICAGLFLAPYAAGNSLLTILAVGVPALWARNRNVWRGFLIYVLVNAFALLPRDLTFQYSASLTTVTLAICWLIFATAIVDRVRLDSKLNSIAARVQ